MIGAWRRWVLPAVAFGLFAGLVGCQEGRAPYPVIDPAGDPGTFLPPDGVALGTISIPGEIYRFDRTRFQLFDPLPGTEPRFIFRDSVLALREAGNPGAPGSLLLRPDLSHPTLAGVYANPALFGFEPASSPSQVGPGPGRSTTSAADFYPTQPGNRWDMNHNVRAWAAVDSMLGPSSAPTGTAPIQMPVVRAVTMSRAREPDLRASYQPATYAATCDFTAERGIGIYYHAWQLIAERVVPRDRQVGSAPAPRDRQMNPRFLWLPLGQSSDPLAPAPVTVDHCVDGLPAHLDFHPLKLTDDEVREGMTYRTWTYLTIDTPVLRERLNSEAELPRGGRCGFDIVVGMDTLRMFPTRTFRMLVRFDVSVERVVDQVTLLSQGDVIGRYPRTAASNSMVKFKILMYTSNGATETAVQRIDLWLQRGIGPVIRLTGLFGEARTLSRLRSAVIDNTVYPAPPDFNPAFEYIEQ
jgi:hypothetical protein